MRILTGSICKKALIALLATWALQPVLSWAADESANISDSAAPLKPTEVAGWNLYGQGTFVEQYHPAFTAPYSGPNSLSAGDSNKETADLTLLLGHRLWDGAEFWANPELDQGFGLSNTLGVAGFTSGEAYKIGAHRPYIRLPRLFVRQVFSLGGETQAISAGPNQMAGNAAANNIIVTLGKFSVVDIFDTNSYAHDPRGDFFNWSVVDGGAFDYAADAWGFTNGVAVEWTQASWTLRGGIFQMSAEPNAKVSGVHFHQFSSVIEVEQRHEWLGHPGKVKVLAFANRADMASYDDAVALGQATHSTPDASRIRRYATNPGAVLNIEQELAANVGAFARVSANSGKKEAYEFTEINRSLSSGMALQGALWGRSDDKLGVAGVINALSSEAKRYFSAGGMGILIGDGQLHYAPEKILEMYYALHLIDKWVLTADYQRVINPAYNQDRGPVSVYGLRLHADF
ncbi:MAG: carbohydrate porin [Nevskiaceae bacterium]|nr:MAG: carbohydrate porin [Nevskiaceae bacterium]